MGVKDTQTSFAVSSKIYFRARIVNLLLADYTPLRLRCLHALQYFFRKMHICPSREKRRKDTSRRARACTPPPVPVPRRPCSRFVSRVLYTPVELEELRNISCKSVLQGTIYSAIILFVAEQATLYAGASVCGSGICSASEPPAYPLTNYHIHHIQQTC